MKCWSFEAGRANFITGELPIRTGLTTVGQAGADVGMPDQAVTLATVLKSLGYETGQFGKNHLGDLNKFLPTVHGFDEFFGYLYHLDAMSDPYWFDYPQDWIDKTGPRNLVHSYATDVDDPMFLGAAFRRFYAQSGQSHMGRDASLEFPGAWAIYWLSRTQAILDAGPPCRSRLGGRGREASPPGSPLAGSPVTRNAEIDPPPRL